jgi:hypothetical protein
MTPSTTAPRQKAVTSDDTTAATLVEIGRLMSELCEIVEAETALVRGGRLTAAVEVASRKSALAHAFMSSVSRLTARKQELAPMQKLLPPLRRQHEQFRAALQLNLTVLATARAVSEGILRGVSTELARRSNVRTYGASGRETVPSRRTGPPIAVSRSL